MINPNLVEALQSLLKQAQSGEIHDAAIIALGDETKRPILCLADPSRAGALVGEFHIFMQSAVNTVIEHRMREQEREDALKPRLFVPGGARQ
jgi:hypothetical protein